MTMSLLLKNASIIGFAMLMTVSVSVDAQENLTQSLSNDRFPLVTDVVAQSYSQDYGVSLIEAKRRLSFLPEIQRVNELLAQNSAAVYGGLQVEHGQTFRVIVNLTQPALGQVALLLSNPLFKVRQVKYTLAELRSSQEDLARALLTAKVDAEVEVQIANNLIELRYIDVAAINALKTSGQLNLAASVRERKVDGLSVTTAAITGGLELTPSTGLEGTSGYSVVGPSGVRGVVTAGHADNRLSVSGRTLTFKDERDCGDVDAQWHTASGSTFPNLIYIVSGNYQITRVENPYLVPANWTVCKYGAVGRYLCGEIQGFVSFNYNGETGTYFRVHNSSNKALSIEGDSGGPVFGDGGAAYGIIHGRGAVGSPYRNDLYFMPQQNLVDLNINIATTP